MELKSLVVAVIMVGMLFSGTFIFLSSLSATYDADINLDKFNKTRDNMEATEERVNETYTIIKNTQFTTDITAIVTIPYDLMRIGWQGLALFFAMPVALMDTVGELITNASDSGFGVPSWFVGGILALIVLGIIIILIEMFFRWKMGE